MLYGAVDADDGLVRHDEVRPLDGALGARLSRPVALDTDERDRGNRPT